MAVMGKKVWALVCGAIREEFELYTTLAMLCDYRSKGMIEGIVICTWKMEIDKISDLRQKLDTLGIYFIELEPLDENIGKFIHINYARQATQLKAGLDFIPDDVFVIRCRTDYSGNVIKFYDKILSGEVDFTLGRHGALRLNLCYRIAVLRLTATGVFNLADHNFLGYKNDLIKMVDLEPISKDLCSDNWFFISLFVHDFPILAKFIELCQFHQLFMEGAVPFEQQVESYLNSHNKNDFYFPTILNKFFALYFVLLKNCFCLIPDYAEKNLVKLDLTDIFTCNFNVGMGKNWCTVFNNKEILRMIVEGECEPTKGYIRLYKEISKLAVEGYAKKINFTKQDYEEAAIWGKEVLKQEPGKWLKWKQIGDVKYNNAGFPETINLLFSNYDVKNKTLLMDTVFNVSFDKNADYYRLILDNLEQFEKASEDVTEIALFTSLRRAIPKALKIVFKKLYFNEIKHKDKSQAEFIVKRSRWNPFFYNFPMHSDRICAFYYYGKYAEASNDIVLSKNFYNRLISDFSLITRPAPSSYADAVLNLIKEIVSIHYKEYKDNLSVRYMIDFLTDEFYDTAFTKDQWDFLAEYVIYRRYALPFKEAAPNAFENLLSGTETAKNDLEANVILKLLLREKWNQPVEMQKKADNAITKLTEKYSSQISCFTKANNISRDDILLFNPSELESGDDFVIFVRILAERKLLVCNKEVLLQTYGEDKFRRTVIELFMRLEYNEDIHFFSMKNGAEMWINYTDFLNSSTNFEFVMWRNNDWWRWPQSDSASSSPFAAYLKLRPNGLFISIEFSSSQCAAKTRLLDNIDKTKVIAFDKNARIIRLKTAVYHFTNIDEIGTAVDKALKDFCDIGEMLTGT